MWSDNNTVNPCSVYAQSNLSNLVFLPFEKDSHIQYIGTYMVAPD